MTVHKGIRIEAVSDESVLKDRVSVGDRLISINGNLITDQLDYQYYFSDPTLDIRFRSEDGKEFSITLSHDQNPGIELEDLSIKQCRNKCIFCYVDQMPAGMRKSLYLKDDDYRLSFLFGSYITLSNISEEEKTRILKQRLSPLYISVHATDESTRTRLMGRFTPILDLIKEFAQGGIGMHIQLVIIPDINDGGILERTIDDLAELFPAVLSIAVVLVGLTRFHNPDLEHTTCEQARAILDIVQSRQHKFRASFGTALVFPSDDLLLHAGAEIPPVEAFEALEQVENGVGMLATFIDQFSELLSAFSGRAIEGEAAIVTGTAFAPYLRSLAGELETFGKGQLTVIPVINRFFGESVSVAGLLSGKDIIDQLSKAEYCCFDKIIIPSVLLNSDGLTIDDMTVDELQGNLGGRVVISGPKAQNLLEIL